MIIVAKKKKKKRVFKIKNIVILLFLMVGLIGFFYWGVMLPIKNVYISGNSIVLDDEIMEISTLDTYPSFLLTTNSFIKKNLKKNLYIQDVNVRKRFGNIIELEIFEHHIVASLDNNLVLSNGVEIENIYNLMDIPVLIQRPDDDKIYKNFASKFSKVNASILRQISQIEYSPVSVDMERFLLYMNDGNLVYVTLTKIDKLNKYDQIKDKLDGLVGTIYLDSGDYMEVKRNEIVTGDNLETNVSLG